MPTRQSAVCYALVVLAFQFFCDQSAAQTGFVYVLEGGDAQGTITFGAVPTVFNEIGPAGGVVFSNITLSGGSSAQATITAVGKNTSLGSGAEASCSMQGSVTGYLPNQGADLDVQVSAVGNYGSSIGYWPGDPTYVKADWTVTGYLAQGDTIALFVDGGLSATDGDAGYWGFNPPTIHITTPGPVLHPHAIHDPLDISGHRALRVRDPRVD